jgi:hypothetical protein
VLGLGCAFLLLASLAAAGALVVLGKSSASSASGGTAGGSSPIVNVPGNTTSPFSVTSDVDFDAEHFDIAAFEPKAERLAREKISDAELIAEDLTGVNPNGVINFSIQSNSMALFRFRSPSRSTAPPEFPKNAVFESNCVVYVMVQKSGVNTFTPDKVACNEPIMNKHRCSVAQVWEKAQKDGAPKGNVIGNMGFNGNMAVEKKLRWYVQVPPNFSAVIPDDC